MKRWILIAVGVLAVGAIVFANLKGSGGPSVKARTSEVEIADVTSRVSAPGRIQAASSVDISAEVPGRIVALEVAEGDSVTKGDLLLKLDDAQYRSRVQQAEAAVRSSRANLALSEARLDRFQQDYRRLKALSESNLASDQALESAATDLNVQSAQVEAQSQDVARMEAALADARDDFSKTVYKAPVSGVVSRLNIEEGEIVITGTMNNPGTVILSIADLSVMEVEAEVDETDVVSVSPGQTVEISVDALPDTTFAGTVVTVGNSGIRSGGGGDDVINFEVEVQFDRSDPRLKPGMTADVDISTRTRKDVLTLPLQALVARSQSQVHADRRAAARAKKERVPESPADSLSGDAKKKWEKEVLEGAYKVVDGEARFVRLTIGVADETRIEVSGDLSEGDEVVSGPYRVLRDLKEGTEIKKSKNDEDKDE